MGKLSELINKETQMKNETKRMTVLIRKLCLSFFALSVCNLIINIFLFDSILGSLVWIGVIALDLLTLFSSYFTSKRVLIMLFVLQKSVWILTMIMLYGWEGGFQFFLILLMIIYSFGEAGYNRKKLLFTFACFLLFVVFLVFFKGKEGIIDISLIDRTIQILNTLVFCMSAALVSVSFSRESQEIEEKIVNYNKQLEIEAGEDALTGLKNRRSTNEFLKRLVSEETVFSICLCDIDFFKKVNDTYGHEFGDDVLVAIAYVFKKMESEGAYISRWGGEEFLLIFPNLNGDEAYVRVHDIYKEIKKLEVPYGEEKVSVTMTYGLTEFDLAQRIEDNIKEVDEKLYMGKQSGRDKIVY